MALVSNDEINAVRAKADIISIVGSYIPLTQKGKNYFCVCPFHDDHSPSMSLSTDKQIYKCFSCGATGNVFTFQNMRMFLLLKLFQLLLINVVWNYHKRLLKVILHKYLKKNMKLWN